MSPNLDHLLLWDITAISFNPNTHLHLDLLHLADVIQDYLRKLNVYIHDNTIKKRLSKYEFYWKVTKIGLSPFLSQRILQHDLGLQNYI